MVFHFNIYSSLLLVFFVHIIIYSFMHWRRGVLQERLSDRLMGGFLFLAALYVMPWMTGFAGWYEQGNPVYRDILFYTPFIQGLFFGPLLFLYVKSVTNFNYKIRGRQWLHFLPGMLYLLWCVVTVVVDKLIVHRYYIMDGMADPDFDTWYELLQIISICLYLFFSLRYYRQYRRFTVFELSFADVASMRWLRNFLVAFAILTLLPLLKEVLSFFPAFRHLEYKGSWYHFLFFAVVVYYIAINGYSTVQLPLRKIFFEPGYLLQYQPPALLPAPAAEEAEFEVITGPVRQEGAAAAMKEQLLAYMQGSKPYLDAEITLSALAKNIGTNTSVLSKVINDGTGQNFNDFINGYRVQEVIAMLKAGEQQRQTLLGIAFDCGFNSKATFNRAFKKATGLSPREYLG